MEQVPIAQLTKSTRFEKSSASPSGELTSVALGTIFRLGPNSTFSIQQTVVGEVPICYGIFCVSIFRFSRIVAYMIAENIVLVVIIVSVATY